MTIHNGSFSVSRYRVIGNNKKFTYQELNKNIKSFQAQPLRLKNVYKELMYGWVRPTGIDSAEIRDGDSWDMSDIRLDDGFFFRIRIEKRKVPKQLLQIVSSEKIELISQERDKPLGRKHKKEIIEATKEELLSQSLPTISYIEAFWDEPNSEVLVFTTSKGALDIFQNLFKQTFSEHLGIKLVKVTQPLLGVDKREWDSAHKDFPKSMDLVGDTLPTIFVEHSVY